jgi:hypothetical protein
MTKNATPQDRADHDRDLVKHASPKYWQGSVDTHDDFGKEIDDTFYDAKSIQGPWAVMTPSSFRLHSYGRTGTGMGRSTNGRTTSAG